MADAARRAGRRPVGLQRARRAAGAAPPPGSRWSPPGCWCGGCSATRSWPGVGAVVLDECHERQLDTDLALAFTVDVRAALRPELLLLATSATAQADRLAAALGDGGAGGRAPGALHPVEVVWCPPSPPVDPPYGLRVDPRLLDHVAATVRRALRRDRRRRAGLPARRRRDRPRSPGGWPAAWDVDVLTAARPAVRRATQDAALRPGPRRRVVLATAVAESSLTVPGVRMVVDAGLARVPRIDLARGLGALVTVRVSRAAAAPAGRAGRARGAGAGVPVLVGRPSTTGCRRSRAGDRRRRPDRVRAASWPAGALRTAPAWRCSTRRRPPRARWPGRR